MKLYEIKNQKFEDAVTGVPISLSGYHYSSDEFKNINQSEWLWFSDDKSWASPWLNPAPKAYKVSVTFSNPLVFLNSNREFESDIGRKLRMIMKQGYDGVIYTPNPNKHASIRQAVYFYPTNKNLIKK